jgi:3D (Asp-Asp-Asp) domain-containing protein/peptidoglycan hydrolase CwlO-like protein
LKFNRFKQAIIATLVLTVCMPVATFADDLNAIKSQEKQVQQESAELSSELNTALTAANEKYQQVEKLQSQVSKAQSDLAKYKDEISKTQVVIEKRKEAVANQMRSLQVENSNSSMLEVLVNSGSLSEFINRGFALSTLRRAQNEKVASLEESKTKLKDLEDKQKQTVTKLETSQASLNTEAKDLEQKVGALRDEVANNKSKLEELANSRVAEEKRQADEKARQEAEAKAAAVAAQKEKEQANNTANNQTDNSSNNSSNGGNEAPSTPVVPDNPSGGGGSVISVQATGYSCAQPGMGYMTATGIDLRKNPNVIAVDPSVIPLGSLVEVSGYGFAVAGDTGGAIIGHIIDLHFPTVEQCIQWGRRNVTVKIL